VTLEPAVSTPPASFPLVFVDDLEHPSLTPDDHHHLQRVLRVRPGAEITISDGRGSWRPARFGDAVLAEGPVFEAPRPVPPLTLAFAPVKGGRPELVTQKLTELGIDCIVPFVAERSVVRWEPGRDRRHVERLRRIAREAAMQSRRCHLPTIGEVATFEDVVALPGAALAMRHGVPPTLERPTLLIGPEGGFSADEIALLTDGVGLGDLVLRAETAAIAGGALLSALRSELVGPVHDPPSQNRR
jgi:16S rRNA (uracil1498-N3)-methyltransferase